MYNNVGLGTARGSGTNAYVQSNVAHLNFSRNKIVYNAEEDIAKAEAEVNKAPNVELLDHEYKRLIEIKCVEFEDLMEGKGFSEEEINTKVNEYRKLLFTEFENGRLNMDGQLDLRNTHSRAKVAKDTRENMRWALGIDAAFVDGSSLEKLKKASESVMKEVKSDAKDKAALDKEMEKSLMEKLLEKIKQKKDKKKEIKRMKKAMRKGKKDESSSSDSSSSDSSSDTDSSDTSSSDSSSSSSVSSCEEKRRKKKQASRKRKGSRGKDDKSEKLKKPKEETEDKELEQSTRKDRSGHRLEKSKGNTDRETLLEPKQEPPETPRFPEEPIQIHREERSHRYRDKEVRDAYPREHRGRDDHDNDSRQQHRGRIAEDRGGERNRWRDDRNRESHADDRHDREKKVQRSRAADFFEEDANTKLPSHYRSDRGRRDD